MTIDWAHFTPWPSILGGVAIGLSAGLLILFAGRIAGISGILGGLLRGGADERGWRAAFVAGLVVAPWVFGVFAALPEIRTDASWPVLIAAGLLVGVGTRLGSGCTSGHGICGLSRLSARSLVAVLTFMAFGFLTVFAVRHLVGG